MSNAEEGKKIKNRTISIKSDRLPGAHTNYPESDSIRVETPAPWIKWHEVTFNQFQQSNRIWSDTSIFHSRGLKIAQVSLGFKKPHDLEFKYGYCLDYDSLEVQVYNRNIIAISEFIIDLLPYSFKHYPIASPFHIYLSVTKKKNMTFNIRPIHQLFKGQKVLDSDYWQRSSTSYYNEQIFHYVSRNRVYKTKYLICSWEKGLWKTVLKISPTKSADLSVARELLGDLRDAIFAYYRQLNQQYAGRELQQPSRGDQ